MRDPVRDAVVVLDRKSAQAPFSERTAISAHGAVPVAFDSRLPRTRSRRPHPRTNQRGGCLEVSVPVGYALMAIPPDG
jgi:hypothetical protein